MCQAVSTFGGIRQIWILAPHMSSVTVNTCLSSLGLSFFTCALGIIIIIAATHWFIGQTE